MSFEQGQNILDKMKELSPNNLAITFFGGEPLLYPDIILALAKYARILWPNNSADAKENPNAENVTFHIVTNGTYFDEEMFKKFKELHFSIQISIDGDYLTTMEHRKGDFDLVVNNAKKIVALFPDMSCRMTMTPNIVGRLAINVKFIREEIGIYKIMHHAVMEADWSDEAIARYTYQLQNLYHYRRYLQKRGKSIQIHFVDRPLAILNDEASPEDNFCEAGKSYICIMPNGDIYPCHRAASNDIFKLGNIHKEKVPFIRGLFLQINKEFAGCTATCFAAKTCHSCPITHYLLNNSLTKPIAKYCRICQIEYTKASEYLHIEISDRRDALITAQSKVILDIANQNEEILKRLGNLTNDK
jgi:uncharacterized protein